MLSRRGFVKAFGGSFLGFGLGSRMSAQATLPGKTKEQPKVALVSQHWRLPESWYRNTVRRLQARLKERGVDGMLLQNRWNIIYVSGLFHTSTERPFYLWVPTQGDPAFFHPGLDRDLVETWWIQDREWYFDFPHAGEFNQLQSRAGRRVDLLQWALRGVAKRGFAKGTIGVEEEPAPSVEWRMKEALPEAKFQTVGETLLKMRQIKTAEEIELTQKAIDLNDRMLEFARSYILEHGTHATDYQVGRATEEFGVGELMKVMRLDGRPHAGVGVSMGFVCRTGVATSFPHVNQFFHARIQRGDAIQIAALIRIGGYGGEGYRALQTEPIKDLQKRMWEVHTEMTLMQASLSKAGVRCQEVAEKILQHGIKNGMEKYIYHRPGHGDGMEGHQPPYVALGDDSVLEEGMMFSNEPGLYDPEGGFGYNHSNNILVQRETGPRMNKTPLTREWCWLKI